MKKTIDKIGFYLLLLCLFLTIPFFWSSAEEGNNNLLGQIMTANEDIEIKESSDAKSGTIAVFQNGDAVFVTGETADGWYQVSYQGKTGYVPKNKLEKLTLETEGSLSQKETSGEARYVESLNKEPEQYLETAGQNNVDENDPEEETNGTEEAKEEEHQTYLDALDAEMAAMEAEGQMVIEEVERQKTEKKRAGVWGAMIGILVVGILGMGIYSMVKPDEKKNNKVRKE